MNEEALRMVLFSKSSIPRYMRIDPNRIDSPFIDKNQPEKNKIFFINFSKKEISFKGLSYLLSASLIND